MGHKSGAYHLIGNFKYLSYYNYDTRLSSPPINTGYFQSNNNFLWETLSFATGRNDNKPVQSPAGFQHPTALTAREIAGCVAKEPQQQFAIIHQNQSTRLNTESYLNAGNKASIPESTKEDALSKINRNSGERKPVRLANDNSASPDRTMVHDVNKNVQQGQMPSQLLRQLGRLLEEYNFGDSDETSEQIQRHDKVNSASHNASSQKLRNISIPGETTKEYVKSVYSQNLKPEFVESVLHVERDRVGTQINRSAPERQDKSYQADKSIHSYSASNSKPVINGKNTRQPFVDETSDIRLADIKYLIYQKPSVQKIDKAKKNENIVKKLTRQVKTKTIKNPLKSHSLATNNYLQRCRLGNSRIRIYK
ncbi:hypothetical protein [Nitrosomonas marina]|nr:hypothetical protein [Nitrosomonas marina]